MYYYDWLEDYNLSHELADRLLDKATSLLYSLNNPLTSILGEDLKLALYEDDAFQNYFLLTCDFNTGIDVDHIRKHQDLIKRKVVVNHMYDTECVDHAILDDLVFKVMAERG